MMERRFSASEAARITGVPPETQLAWRKRGYLPETGGKHSRWTVRELCRLRLMRALVEAGFPIGLAVQKLSDDFLDSLQSQVILHGSRQDYDAMLAVVGYIGKDLHRYIVFKMSDLSIIEKRRDCPFDSFHVIRLSRLAEDLCSHIKPKWSRPRVALMKTEGRR